LDKAPEPLRMAPRGATGAYSRTPGTETPAHDQFIIER